MVVVDIFSLDEMILYMVDVVVGDILLQQGNFFFDKMWVLFQYVRSCGMMMVFNFLFVNFDFCYLWFFIDIVVVNEFEVELFQLYGVKILVIIQGVVGVWLVQEGLCQFCFVVFVEVFDIIGVGDMFFVVMLVFVLLCGVVLDVLVLVYVSCVVVIMVSCWGMFSVFFGSCEFVVLLIMDGVC